MADTVTHGDHSDGRQSATASGPAEDAAKLEPDDIYHILQTSRRRHVLEYLRIGDEPMTLRTLAERIAAREHGTTVENLTSSQRQRVYISLYQSHLPKLDTRGIVEYDKDRGTVESTPLAAEFDPYLTGLDESSPDPWLVRYAATVGCCGLVLAAIGVGLIPLSWALAAVLVVVTFATVTAGHAYTELSTA
ncbi:DUF7344 domain-containing protein [Natronolimnohabitans innermongolicus]|uniref:DUF7344 domain-containing protein n=1 Tax=Natronolimnohabitans innermongolicus JCM 12255 TaxID=1227499 RepID=L9X787_9EURY|nr:hypothetical protein [Natronolimnohabitans innermongolicus]ELY57462.1 hypothetical protein C493_08251 [Natronolimnohabitans innermongolicus JCM 12255]